jgi:hypothetical protein
MCCLSSVCGRDNKRGILTKQERSRARSAEQQDSPSRDVHPSGTAHRARRGCSGRKSSSSKRFGSPSSFKHPTSRISCYEPCIILKILVHNCSLNARLHFSNIRTAGKCRRVAFGRSVPSVAIELCRPERCCSSHVRHAVQQAPYVRRRVLPRHGGAPRGSPKRRIIDRLAAHSESACGLERTFGYCRHRRGGWPRDGRPRPRAVAHRKRLGGGVMHVRNRRGRVIVHPVRRGIHRRGHRLRPARHAVHHRRRSHGARAIKRAPMKLPELAMSLQLKTILRVEGNVGHLFATCAWRSGRVGVCLRRRR